MKKLMFILLLIIPVFIINAQDVEPKKEELASIQVIDHLYDKTEQAITTLAKALEVPAEHVYNVLVKQQIVKGISITLGMIISILLSAISIIVLLKVHNFEEDCIYQNTEGYWVISGIFVIVTLVMIIAFIADGIPRLANPEYGAIKDIMTIL